MTERSRSFLDTKDLVVGYKTASGENRLFENLNLSLYPGELVCFMGPNGSGKSTLIRSIAGLQKPLAGSVNIHRAGNNKIDPTQIAVVLTDRITAVNLTVYELIGFGRYPYLGWNISLTQKDKAMIDQSIELVHVGHLIHKRLFELSDGQLQMVMIARALAQDTPVILLDEPTAHLDLNNRVEIMNLLRNLSRTTQKAILVSTHELDLALQTADLIWLTGKDRNMLTGVPEDLVLDGSFDEIFRFKGFDLKTGKLKHEAFRGIAIQLSGKGHEYLWTKNALERCGYDVINSEAAVSINISQEAGRTEWQLRKSDKLFTTMSLQLLIKTLEEL
ncbi:MAG: ABC transporter ATP-binding protein [Bacteroidota bacterium]